MEIPRARAALAAVMLVMLGACEPAGPAAPGSGSPAAATRSPADEVVLIRMAGGDEIQLRLFPDKAPKHVANFKKLARQGYYDGTTFHRVIPNFMIQGGDHLSKDDDTKNDGTGTPGYFIPAEFNDVTHRRGIVAMGRRSHPDSAGSQFYIMVADSPRWGKILDGKYTVFGEVTSGMDVVDRIVAAPRDVRDRPLEDQVMAQVAVRPGPEE